MKKKKETKILYGIKVPDWYFPHHMPYVRNKPEETILNSPQTIATYDDNIELKTILDMIGDKDIGNITISAVYDGDGDTEIKVIEFISVPNPYYELELKHYNNQLAELEKWKLLKPKIDAAKIEEDKARKFEQYLKLKAEFESKPIQ
jgi:hypothetical protein